MAYLVAVTACVSGVAHTYMAAERLEKLCLLEKWGVSIETQGALGTENRLADEDIRRADVALLITDIELAGAERFEHCRYVQCSIYAFLREPQRGEIIVFKYPSDTRRDFIKRVIAVGGDTIEIRDGKTFVNGEAIDESYIKEPFHTNYGKVTVPKGFIFVMGDNRNNSEDSRYADVGFVDLSLVKGKASVVFWPFSEFKALP